MSVSNVSRTLQIYEKRYRPWPKKYNVTLNFDSVHTWCCRERIHLESWNRTKRTISRHLIFIGGILTDWPPDWQRYISHTSALLRVWMILKTVPISSRERVCLPRVPYGSFTVIRDWGRRLIQTRREWKSYRLHECTMTRCFAPIHQMRMLLNVFLSLCFERNRCAPHCEMTSIQRTFGILRCINRNVYF